MSRISVPKGANFRGRKSNSLMNLCGKKGRTFATIDGVCSELVPLVVAIYLFSLVVCTLVSQLFELISSGLDPLVWFFFSWLRFIHFISNRHMELGIKFIGGRLSLYFF